MRRMGMAIALMAGILISVGAVAQRERQGQTTPQTGPPAGRMGSGGMMQGGMMQRGMAMGQQMMCGEGMCPHQEVGNLVEKLMASFAAMEGETDPAALKDKLVEHGVLLKELQTKSQATCPMMQMMQQHEMTDPMENEKQEGD